MKSRFAPFLPARSLTEVTPESGSTRLRQLLTEPGADVYPGLAVVEAEPAESAAVAEKYAAARDW